MLIFKRPQVFRNAEGEGAGGGMVVAEGDQQPTSAPADDKMTALEQRLARISGAVEGMTAQQKRQSQIDQITAKDNELVNAKREAENAVAAAEKQLAQAYDDGEGLEIAKAQRLLSESVAKVERRDADLTNWREQVKAAERKQQSAPKGGDLDDSNLQGWKQKHADWYGVDAAMTKASHEIDRQIREAGVLSVGSKEYFDAIDRSLSQRYPDRFGGTPETRTSGGQQVQPNTPIKGRISKSIAEGYRRMGIDIDDPKTAERMLKNREAAVQKGILPSQPVQGSIVTR